MLLSAPGSSQAQVLSADWDFDDGTLQGWTTVSGDVTQQVFAPMTHGPLFGSAPGPQAGTHVVGVNMGYDPPIDSPWDAAHETMWLRSPEFLITGTTEVSFYLTGGPGDPTGLNNISNVPANSQNNAGFMGIAVRQASTGNIVATGNLETESPFGWVELTIGQASLGAYAGDGLSYTLEFIDARHGGWGFTALDTVSVIPEPSTYALFAGLGILGLAILRRRFRK